MIVAMVSAWALFQLGNDLFDSAGPCALPLENGAILSGGYPDLDISHSIGARNGSQSTAYVKVHNVATGQRTLMFLNQNGSGEIGNLPDGRYEVLFAFGGRLAADCGTLIGPESVSKFTGQRSLQTTVKSVSGGREIATQVLNFTLFSMPGGNTTPRTVSVEEFNRD